MVRRKPRPPGAARRPVHRPRHHAHVHPLAACRPLALVAAPAPQSLVVGGGCSGAPPLLLGGRTRSGSAPLRRRGMRRGAAAARRQPLHGIPAQGCRRHCRHSPHVLAHGQGSALFVGESAQRHLLLPPARHAAPCHGHAHGPCRPAAHDCRRSVAHTPPQHHSPGSLYAAHSERCAHRLRHAECLPPSRSRGCACATVAGRGRWM